VCLSREFAPHHAPQHRAQVNSTKQLLYFDWAMDNAFDYWLVPETMSIHANNSNVTLHAARVDLYDYDALTPPGNLTQVRLIGVAGKRRDTVRVRSCSPMRCQGWAAHTHGVHGAAHTNAMQPPCAAPARTRTHTHTHTHTYTHTHTLATAHKQLAQHMFDPVNATAGPAYLGTALTAADIAAFGNLQSVGSFVPLAPYMGKRVLVAFRYSTTVYYLTWMFDNVSVGACARACGRGVWLAVAGCVLGALRVAVPCRDADALPGPRDQH
jgi:hypothetical protein